MQVEFLSDGGEHFVKWARYAARLERLHERRRESDLPVREEAPELFFGRLRSVRRLLLVGAKRSQLPMCCEDLLYELGAQRADQLVLQIPLARGEAKPLHPGAVEVTTEACALEGRRNALSSPASQSPASPTFDPSGP